MSYCSCCIDIIVTLTVITIAMIGVVLLRFVAISYMCYISFTKSMNNAFSNGNIKIIYIFTFH